MFAALLGGGYFPAVLSYRAFFRMAKGSKLLKTRLRNRPMNRAYFLVGHPYRAFWGMAKRDGVGSF